MIQRTKYLDIIKPFIGKDVVKVLTGMRRSGKSTLLDQIKAEIIAERVSPQNVVTINFESLRFDYLADSPEAFYEEMVSLSEKAAGTTYFFFDEIQMAASWERIVTSLRIDLDCDIYITGSNANLLSGELATLLGGRYVTFEIMPFSFAEERSASPAGSDVEAFDIYRTLGGLPFLAQIGFSRQESLTYLRDIYSSIVLKDIVQRKGFRDVDQLERILSYFISEIGTTYSVKNIANVLAEERRPISRESIYNYLAAAEEAMLLARVKRYDVKGKNILRGFEKIYVTDVGLREALFGDNGQRVDIVLENIVFCELKRRGFEIFIGKNDNKEIDFVARKEAAVVYIQVAYLLSDEGTRAREFGAFKGIEDNFTKMVISMDTVDFSYEGIRHMNIKRFLQEVW